MGHPSARTTARYVSGSDEFQQKAMQRQSAQISKIMAGSNGQDTRKVATKVATQRNTA
jgi:hypothetical protein